MQDENESTQTSEDSGEIDTESSEVTLPTETETTTSEEEETTTASTGEEETTKAKGKEDTETALREKIARLEGKLEEVSAQVRPPKQEEPEEDESGLYEGLIPPKDWKPKRETYAELMSETLKRSGELFQRMLASEIQKAQKESDKMSKEDAKLVHTFYSGVDRLREEGKIPTVANPNDPKDPGMVVENQLKELAGKFNTVDVDLLYNEIYKRRLNKRVPTKPSITSQKGVQTTGKVINYEKEIKGKSLMDILGDQEEA